MDKLYLDANVILDYLQSRRNGIYTEKIFLMAHRKQVELITSVLNFATFYCVEKQRGFSRNEIYSRFIHINKVISAIDQTARSFQSALKSRFSDFEDALQYFAAIEETSNMLITGNKKDFKESAIPVLTAKEFVAQSNQQDVR